MAGCVRTTDQGTQFGNNEPFIAAILVIRSSEVSVPRRSRHVSSFYVAKLDIWTFWPVTNA